MLLRYLHVVNFTYNLYYLKNDIRYKQTQGIDYIIIFMYHYNKK